MKRTLCILICNLYAVFFCIGQGKGDLVFIADIQKPTWPERSFLKTDRNTEAADTLFANLLRTRFRTLFILGDLVSIGSDDHAWVRVSRFIAGTRKRFIPVYAIPGNHEYMFCGRKGFGNYYQRFPDYPENGYCIVTDSIAVIMLNSNFGKLREEEVERQQKWYEYAMDSLNRLSSVKVIIVCCHHSPYTNSKTVGPSKKVQQRFVPKYIATPKALLFLSGHAHSLELFSEHGKYFMVIGGGGGIAQKMLTGTNRFFPDLLAGEQIPRFFYIVVQRKGLELKVSAKGFMMEEFGRMSNYPLLNMPL